MQFRSALLTLAILAGSAVAAPRPFVQDIMQKRQAMSSSSAIASATPAVSVVGSTWVPVSASATPAVSVVGSSLVPLSSMSAATITPPVPSMTVAAVMAGVTESVSVVIPAVVADAAGPEGTEVIIMEGSAFYDAAMVMVDLMDAQGIDTVQFREMLGMAPL